MVLLGFEFILGCGIGVLLLYLLYRYRAELLDLVALVILFAVPLGLVALAVVAPWPGVLILVGATFLGVRGWLRYQRALVREYVASGRWVPCDNPSRFQRVMRHLLSRKTT
jgi:hypothetical protein